MSQSCSLVPFEAEPQKLHQSIPEVGHKCMLNKFFSSAYTRQKYKNDSL